MRLPHALIYDSAEFDRNETEPSTVPTSKPDVSGLLDFTAKCRAFLAAR